MKQRRVFTLLTSKCAALCVLALVCLALSACQNGQDPKPNNGDREPNTNGSSGTEKQPKVEPPSDPFEFIVDRRLDENGRSLGPLESYPLQIDLVVDNDATVMRGGTLFGETVLFGIPDRKGDLGESYQLARQRIVDMLMSKQLPEIAETEDIQEGTIALVRLETPSYPSGMTRGERVPVKIASLGNAVDIVYGSMYPTKLVSQRGNSAIVSAKSPNWRTQILPEDIRSASRYFDAVSYVDPNDPDGGSEQSDPTQRQIALSEYLLPGKFTLTRDITWDEQNRTMLSLTLVDTQKYTSAGELREQKLPAADGVVEAVIESIRKRYPYFKVHQRPAPERNVVDVVATFPPELREGQSRKQREFGGDLNRLYDEIRALWYQRRPRNRLHIVADDNNGRILVIGPEDRKKLAGGLEFAQRSSDHPKEYRPTGRFRLIASPREGRNKLFVSWSRFNEDGSKVVARGDKVIPNDIAQLLRLAYASGCKPLDCLNIVVLAQYERLISARLLENPIRYRPKALADEDNDTRQE